VWLLVLVLMNHQIAPPLQHLRASSLVYCSEEYSMEPKSAPGMEQHPVYLRVNLWWFGQVLG
jgi:hypothetical protein